MKFKKKIVWTIFLFISMNLVSQEAEQNPEPPETTVPETGILDQFFEVDGLNQWQYEFDLNGLKEGTYNVLVQAVDNAGNIVQAEAVDFKIDPESDLPRVSLTYPSEGRAMKGKIMVLGTAEDDDQVDYVEVRLGEGPYTRAQGQNYWSHIIDSKDFEDGEYTLSYRSTDINGLTGHEKSTNFYIDNNATEILIESHQNGNFISKKVGISGTITDLNGIKGLEVSLDNGETYIPVKVKGKVKDGIGTFTYSLDSRDLEDGPHTITFKGEDFQGSIGYQYLFLYIDNSPPVLEFIYPVEEEPANGIFKVIGRVFDDVGIESLSYIEKGEDPREIPITPGDPFWSIEIEKLEEKQFALEFLLTDTAGNESKYSLKQKLLPEKDYPSLLLSESGEVPVLLNKTLSGWLIDTSSPGGILYELDGNDEVRLESGRFFSLDFSDLPAGEHEIILRPWDKKGPVGAPLKTGFIIPAEKASIAITEYISKSETPESYKAGSAIDPEQTKGVRGTVQVYSGQAAGTALFPDGQEINLKLNKTDQENILSFEIKLPSKIEGFGFYPVDIRIKDLYGPEETARVAFWIENPEGGSTEKGIFPLFVEEDILHPTKELSFLIKGASPADVKLNTEMEGIETVSSSETITVRLQEEFNASNLKIQGPGNLSSSSFSMTRDLEAPNLNIKILDDDLYLRQNIELTGTLRDNHKIDSLEYSLGDNDFKELMILPASEEEQTENKWNFNASISIEDQADGPLKLRIRARDESGLSTVKSFYMIKDTEAPVLKQILPGGEETVNGQFSLYIDLNDPWTEKFQGQYKLADQIIELSHEGGQILIPLDFSAFESLPENFELSYSDITGNVIHYKPKINFDPLQDKPQVQIHVPFENSLIQEDCIFSGIVLDDDGVQRIEYRLDEEEFQELPGASSFEIPIPISKLTDNEHTFEIRAFDLGGVESNPLIIPFKVSLNTPEGELLLPELGDTRNETVLISGTAYDANGIEAVYISLDNGNSFHKAEGREEWQYTINSEIMADGNHLLLIKTVDMYGVEGIASGLISIDNKAPSLDISIPRDGTLLTDQLFLQMRITDNLSVEQINYTIKPISASTLISEEEDSAPGQENPGQELEGSIEGENVVLKTIDLEGLHPGRYNLSLYVQDDAGNETALSRNFVVKDTVKEQPPRILFPLNGARVSATFTLEGEITGDIIPESVSLYKNGEAFAVIPLEGKRFFSREILAEEVEDGPLNFKIVQSGKDAGDLESPALDMSFNSHGPWLLFDSVKSGDSLSSRPWIRGRAGYIFPEAENPEEGLSKDLIKAGKLESLEYSLDHGKSFKSIKAKEAWEFRLETREIPDGPQAILVKAVFKNGETAIRQVHVLIDKTEPETLILTPYEDAAVNGKLQVNGTAFDENGLEHVSIMLRKNSKSRHEIPSFVQGLYLDTHFLGATFWEFGVGLTFFDDNVRLQGMIGMAPEGRFNGTVFGVKLLANVATLPYGYFFGPDWDFLSSSIAIGSAFEYFTMSEGNTEQDGLVLGALIAQIELVKVEVETLKFFNAYSFFMENQFWFISSDIDGGIAYKAAFGLRINVF